jgi:hypothetical protein
VLEEENNSIYDIPKPLVLSERIYQSILEINESLEQLNNLELELISEEDVLSFTQKYTITKL